LTIPVLCSARPKLLRCSPPLLSAYAQEIRAGMQDASAHPPARRM
jgi:hypothetical protein